MGSWHQSYEEFIAPHRFETPTSQLRLMEAICERKNMKSAIKRVIRNKGAPGVDGMAVHKINPTSWFFKRAGRFRACVKILLCIKTTCYKF